MTYEIRTADLWPDVDYELRAASDGFTFDGYAAVFNKLSLPLRFPGVGGGRRFQEIIAPGAFTDTLAKNPDVGLRFQHDLRTLPLARTSAGTMTLEQDSTGLRVRATLPDNEWGRPVRDAIARGDVRGMSFSFGNAKDAWSQDGAMRIRRVTSLDLGPEVSLSDMPAYPDTAAFVRAFAEAIEANPDEMLAELKEALADKRVSADQIVSAINEQSDTKFVSAASAAKMEAMRRRLEKVSAA